MKKRRRKREEQKGGGSRGTSGGEGGERRRVKRAADGAGAGGWGWGLWDGQCPALNGLLIFFEASCTAQRRIPMKFASKGSQVI